MLIRSISPATFALACITTVAIACGGTPRPVGVDYPDAEADDASAEDGRAAPNDAAAGLDGSSKDGSSPTDGASDAAIADAGEDAQVAAPAVRYVGRSDVSDPLGPKFAWQGSRAIVRFSGTEVAVTLKDTPGQFGGSPSYFDVQVDGTWQTPIMLTPGTATYTLASGLAAGTHVVELYKRTEPYLGVTQVLGFDFPGGGRLLAPPPAPTRRIEFLSDSTVNGYGVEGVGPNCPGGAPALTHNSRRSMPQLVADAVNADLVLLAFSGKGIVKNEAAGDTEVFDRLYGRSLPEDVASVWSFARYTPDVVVSVLGGTDYSPPTAANPTLFAQKYDALVGRIRTNYPLAQIILAVGPQLSDDFPVGFNTRSNVKNTMMGIVNARTGTGDTRIHFFEFAASTDASLVTACYYHANATFHEQMATAFLPFVKAKTGW